MIGHVALSTLLFNMEPDTGVLEDVFSLKGLQCDVQTAAPSAIASFRLAVN